MTEMNEQDIRNTTDIQRREDDITRWYAAEGDEVPFHIPRD